MGRGFNSFCRLDSRSRSDQLECRADASQNSSVPRCLRETRATTSHPQVRLEGDAFFENGCMIEERQRLPDPRFSLENRLCGWGFETMQAAAGCRGIS